MATPIDIEHDTQRNILTITWSDEIVSEYPLAYIRGWCPCAGCQGHGGSARFQAVENVSASHIQEVGSYALGFRFSDGHDTGIYSWKWLRRIAAESPPPGYKSGSFVDGQFGP